LGIAVALSFVAVSNPSGLVALGVYGFLDASGALDDLKESLGSETVILKRNTD
jgi:hypothetical protein